MVLTNQHTHTHNQHALHVSTHAHRQHVKTLQAIKQSAFTQGKCSKSQLCNYRVGEHFAAAMNLYE